MAQTGSKGNSKQKKINCDEFGKKITLSDVMNDMTFVDKLEELEEKKAIPAIVLYCATCRNIRNVIIAMVTPVVIKSYDE